MEHLEELRSKLIEDGFDFTPILDGSWHKIKSPIKGRYATSIYPTGVVMTIMSWDEEFKKTYKCGNINGEADEFIKKQSEETKEIKRIANEKAALQAKQIWENETLRDEGNAAISPYLQSKGLGRERFGARLDARTGTKLIIPSFDGEGKLWGLQTIFASGDKAFIKGQRKEGCYHLIGNLGKRLYIAEGFATGASVHLATKNAVAIAFDAGNLKRVAKVFREKYPNLEIIIAGDNDQSLTGQNAAQGAAKEINGHFFYPQAVGKDWNDCLIEKGLPFLTECFENFTKSLKPQPRRFAFHIQTFDEIKALNIEDPTWLSQQFLPEIGISALFGKPKAGKSTLARHLMCCVAEGSEFLGRPTKQGKVIYLAMEENLAHLRDQLTKRGIQAGSETSQNILIHCSSFLPTNPLEALNSIISEKKNVKLVIFDTLFKIIRAKDEHAYQENMQLLEKLAQLAEEHKIHVMGIHHAKKGDHADGDAALGSTAITGAFDANIFLRLDENHRRIISSQHRYGEPFEKTILGFNKAEYRFTVDGSVSETRNKEDRTKIWAAIREAGEPISAANIASSIGIRKQSVIFTLDKDVKDGLVVRTGAGTKVSPKVYSLAESVLRSTDQF